MGGIERFVHCGSLAVFAAQAGFIVFDLVAPKVSGNARNFRSSLLVKRLFA